MALFTCHRLSNLLILGIDQSGHSVQGVQYKVTASGLEALQVVLDDHVFGGLLPFVGDGQGDGDVTGIGVAVDPSADLEFRGQLRGGLLNGDGNPVRVQPVEIKPADHQPVEIIFIKIKNPTKRKEICPGCRHYGNRTEIR